MLVVGWKSGHCPEVSLQASPWNINPPPLKQKPIKSPSANSTKSLFICIREVTILSINSVPCFRASHSVCVHSTFSFLFFLGGVSF